MEDMMGVHSTPESNDPSAEEIAAFITGDGLPMVVPASEEAEAAYFLAFRAFAAGMKWEQEYAGPFDGPEATLEAFNAFLVAELVSGNLGVLGMDAQ